VRKRKTLRTLLIFLGRLMDDPSKLPPTKRNAAIARAARIEARGWKYLAGEGGDIDELIELAGSAFGNPGEPEAGLLRNRNVPESNGRRVGSKEKKYAAKDALIIADIRKGVERPAAIRARYPVRKQYATHSKRIKRKMDEQDVETRAIIGLQTPFIRPVDIK
jgi:hypothetical protein